MKVKKKAFILVISFFVLLSLMASSIYYSYSYSTSNCLNSNNLPFSLPMNCTYSQLIPNFFHSTFGTALPDTLPTVIRCGGNLLHSDLNNQLCQSGLSLYTCPKPSSSPVVDDVGEICYLNQKGVSK